MSCILSWILCKVIIHSPFQMPVADSSSKLFAIINLAKLIRPFVTHLSTPLTRMNSAHSPNVSFFFSNFLSKLSQQSLPHHSPSTDVGRIPNFILFLSACQFWKGEAGQKIISRTSHKSLCEGGRCGCGGGELPLGLPKDPSDYCSAEKPFLWLL